MGIIVHISQDGVILRSLHKSLLLASAHSCGVWWDWVDVVWILCISGRPVAQVGLWLSRLYTTGDPAATACRSSPGLAEL